MHEEGPSNFGKEREVKSRSVTCKNVGQLERAKLFVRQAVLCISTTDQRRAPHDAAQKQKQQEDIMASYCARRAY